MAPTTPTKPVHPSKTGRLSQRLVLASFTSWDIATLTLFLATFSLFRASDLSYSVVHETTLAELAIPIAVWDAAFYTVAWLLFVGLAAQRHFIVWCGHAIGIVLYFGLTVGAFVHLIALQQDGPITALLPAGWWHVALYFLSASVIVAACFAGGWGGGVPTATKWVTLAVCGLASFVPIIPLDGSRQLGPLAAIVLIHGYTAARMGPWPLIASEMRR